MQLRYYQTEAVDAVFAYFESGKTGHPLIVMPTGTGKSIVIAEFVRRAVCDYPGTRILKLTHRKELIAQNYKKLLQIWPTAPAGVYSSGLGRKELRQITFGGIGSLATKGDSIGHVDLVLIDEAHLLPHKEATNYRRLIKDLMTINPELRVIGLTATPYRLGQGMLTDEGGIFTDVCYNISSKNSFNRLIKEGFLAPLVPVRTSKQIDVTGVRVQGGEFNQRDLQAACDREEITRRAVNEMVERSEGREHWLVFATGVDHCNNTAQILQETGVDAFAVHSKMPESERDSLIARFCKGEVKCLVNDNILTTGFDAPFVDMIGVLKPTNSCAVWVQTLGRGTRPCEGKENCLVLDFAGNTRRLGPINDPQTPKKKGKRKGQGAPVRVCEKCDAYSHASARICEHCGEPFPLAVKFSDSASDRELIAGFDEPKYEIFIVKKVEFSEHPARDGKPPSLKVRYTTPLFQEFQEWQCLEHGGSMQAKARRWWFDSARHLDMNTSADSYPLTVEEALSRIGELSWPKHIRVQVGIKYPRVVSRDFNGTAFGTKKL